MHTGEHIECFPIEIVKVLRVEIFNFVFEVFQHLSEIMSIGQMTLEVDKHVFDVSVSSVFDTVIKAIEFGLKEVSEL